jgi:uncharacterized sulfatase
LPLRRRRSPDPSRRAGVLVLTAGIGLAAGRALAAAATPPRPDVLLLLVDDLLPSVSCAPALAARSRRFENAYLPHPAAGPARASVFFGQRPERSGIWSEAAERPGRAPFLAQAFGRGGYQTVRIGRAVGGDLDARLPWDVAEGAPAAPQDTVSRILALLAAPREKPLFLTASVEDLGTLAPAPAAAGPASGPSRPAIALGDLPALAPPGGRAPLPLATAEGRQKARAAYDTREGRLCGQLERLAAALDRDRRWPTTVLAVAGAQAPRLGDDGVPSRTDALAEEVLRTPLLIAAPSATAGTAALRAVELTDLFPTLLDLAGIRPPPRLDGRSLQPLLHEPGDPATVAISVARREPGHLARSVRTDRWRYTLWPDGSQELYDQQADPGEHANLAARTEHASTVRELRALLERPDTAPSPPPPAAPPPRRRRPNVLLIVLDDLSVHLGAYGYPVRTPNIDRLAQRGRRFDRAYAQVAMCNPSRASLLSGWRPERTAVWDNNESPRRPGIVPLQEHFAANGYYTAHVGKIWETRFARQFKWDFSEYVPPGEAEAAAPPERPERRGLSDVSSYWKITDNRDEDEPDGRRARRVVELLGQKRDRPFFIGLGFAKPHLRWVAPRRWFGLYDPSSLALAPEPADDAADIPEIALEYQTTWPGRFATEWEPSADDALRRQAIAAYYATVSFVDAQVGVVLDALDRLKLWDDTVVVLLGDHGFHLGDHRGLWRKDTLFEEALRAPLIVAAPDLPRPGAATSSLAELLDLYPTLLELTGLPSVPGLDGVSLGPVLRDPAASVRPAARSVRHVRPPTHGRSLRSGKWRYTLWPDGSEELYDLDQPPPRQDQAPEPDKAAVLAELRGLLVTSSAGRASPP